MKALLGTLVLAATCTAAAAENYNVGAGLSPFGLQIEGSKRINKSIAIRGFVTGGINLDYNEAYTLDTGDAYSVDGSLNLGGVGLLADYYPTSTGWRISGGLFASFSNAKTTLTGPQTFEASLKLDSEIAPMLTTGYRHSFANNWTISGDIGAVFSKLTVASTSTDPNVASEVTKINAELDDISIVPYLAVTIGYNF